MAKIAEAKSQPIKGDKPVKVRRNKVRAPRFLRAIGRYFKGSWQELREVRWPNRRATWGLTFAVILFSIFFAVLILLLDVGFQFLFRQVLLK